MKLLRPIVFFDLETTGTDVAKDRIVSFCAVKIDHFDAVNRAVFDPETVDLLFNPGVTMSPEVIAIHGLTNEMVANKGTFKEYSTRLHEYLQDCDLAGFNLANFDVPLLWEEFFRAGISWDLTGTLILDAGVIFKKKEERTLSAALQFYCNTQHDGAHNAKDDVLATIDVLMAQRKRYPDLGKMDVAQLAEFSRFDNRVDLAGKIVRNEKGEPIYNIGQAKGKRVVDDPGFGHWMLGKDFPQNTKLVLSGLLKGDQQKLF